MGLLTSYCIGSFIKGIYSDHRCEVCVVFTDLIFHHQHSLYRVLTGLEEGLLGRQEIFTKRQMKTITAFIDNTHTKLMINF